VKGSNELVLFRSPVPMEKMAMNDIFWIFFIFRFAMVKQMATKNKVHIVLSNDKTHITIQAENEELFII
jgi:hypothetical protein